MADTATEIVEAPQTPIQAVKSNTLNMVEQLLQRPDLDIEKLDKLLNLQAREEAKYARSEYLAAVAQAQPEIPPIPKNGKGNNDKRYALWEDMQAKVFPVTSKYGLTVTHKTRVENDRVIVTCIISHVGGHEEVTELPLPIDGTGSKNAVQAIGSSVSYGKRYTAAALLGIRLEGEDNDGAGVPAETINDDQVEELKGLLSKAGRDVPKFMEYMKVDRFEDITVKGFEGVVVMLRQKIAEAEKQGA